MTARGSWLVAVSRVSYSSPWVHGHRGPAWLLLGEPLPTRLHRSRGSLNAERAPGRPRVPFGFRHTPAGTLLRGKARPCSEATGFRGPRNSHTPSCVSPWWSFRDAPGAGGAVLAGLPRTLDFPWQRCGPPGAVAVPSGAVSAMDLSSPLGETGWPAAGPDTGQG